MAKKKPKNTFIGIDYETEATPKATTADGVPVFCSHDEIADIAKVIPNPKNPNQHDDKQVALLASIIESTGWRQPITISKRSGFIVKGHGRLMAAAKKGWTQVPVDYQEYANDAEEWADLIADNRLAELSTLDTGRLVDLINDMDTGEAPIELTGYTEEDIAEIIASLEGADDTMDNKADAVEKPSNIPMSQAGDLWLLGQHRLICGSATDEKTVERLMNGEKADLVNTDPPYGVSYESQSGKFDMIQNDDLTGDDLMQTLLIPAFKNYAKFTKDDAAFYIWHASSTRRDFEDAMTAAGIVEKQYIIWVKTALVLGHADYQWAHEPCFYAEKAGHSAHFYGDRAQRTTWKVVLRDEDGTATVLSGGVVLTDGAGNKVYIADKPPKGKKIRYIRLSEGRSVSLYSTENDRATDTWEVSRETNTEHPTQKPVELAIRAIDNSTEPGDLVVDFFGGSGSTLRGAELTGRRCNTIELDPRYCDVIINSYVRLTGNVGVTCERDGQTYQYTELKQENDLANAGGGVNALIKIIWRAKRAIHRIAAAIRRKLNKTN
ncbi:MAG: site-specific DNA-methyltransferase [Clostridia bacterium]|nr:site-specific DNA-methyltransferase [Clostridia bacterium]